MYWCQTCSRPRGHRGRQVAAEALGEPRGVVPAARGPLVEPRQLREPDRRGEVRRLRVRAQRLVVVADAHAVVAEQAEAVGERVVVGRREAALAGHEVLRRVQAEHRRAEAPGAPAVVRGAVRLCGVLDDGEPVAVGDRHDRVHVGHEAVQVDRHDRLRPRRDGGLDESGSMQKSSSRTSTKTGRAPVSRIALTVALNVKLTVTTSSPGPMPSARRMPTERHGPVRHQDRVADAAVRGPGLLELGGPAAHRQHPGAQHLEDGLLLGLAHVRLRDRDHTGASVRSGMQLSPSRTYRASHAVQWTRPRVVAAARTPSGPTSRCPHAHTQPRRRAGFPTTSAWSGTSRVTTAPAPTVANRPMSVPATTTTPAPIDAAAAQADRAHDPVLGPRELARGGDRAREPVVGEDRVGSDEHAVLDGHPVVHERRVLDLHPVADDDALVDERVPADDALRADPCPAADLGAVPDARPGPDLDVRFDVRGRVDARRRMDLRWSAHLPPGSGTRCRGRGRASDASKPRPFGRLPCGASWRAVVHHVHREEGPKARVARTAGHAQNPRVVASVMAGVRLAASQIVERQVSAAGCRSTAIGARVARWVQP